MWRTYLQNQVSTCVTGSPVPLRAAHARGPWTRFVVGALKRTATDSRESTWIASRRKMETRLAAAAVPWKWTIFGVFFCSSWGKSRFANLSKIICFLFASFLPLGRSAVSYQSSKNGCDVHRGDNASFIIKAYNNTSALPYTLHYVHLASPLPAIRWYARVGAQQQ